MKNKFSKPFLTQLDSRAKIKGSRDPLGFQIIWTLLGRRIIKNLTTVTTSPRNFTVQILGYYFANKLVTEKGAELQDFANIFLKFEQLAAYSRYSQNIISEFSEEEMRGILRVKKNLAANRKVIISADQDAQILANQKTYGIWGLYTVASKSSGIIEETEYRLKSEATEFVEKNYLKLLSGSVDYILSILSKNRYSFDPDKKDKMLSQQIAKILSNRFTENEVGFYTNYLVYSGNEKSDQKIIWEEIKELNRIGYFNWSDSFNKRELIEITKRIDNSENQFLSEKLKDILIVENVIGPLALIFNYLMGKDQSIVSKIAVDIKKSMGNYYKSIDLDNFTKVARSLGSSLSNDSINNLIQLAESLLSADYEKTIEHLVKRNLMVMKDRGGNPWLRIERDKLDVRFREDMGDLPAREDYKDLWVHPYFLNSLKVIGYRIQRGKM